MGPRGSGPIINILRPRSPTIKQLNIQWYTHTHTHTNVTMSCMQFVPVPHHSSVRNTYKRLWSHCPAPTNALAAMPWKKMKLHDVVVDWVWDRHCQIFVWFWNACITWHNPKAFRLYRSSSYLLLFLSSLNSVHYVWRSSPAGFQPCTNKWQRRCGSCTTSACIWQ